MRSSPSRTAEWMCLARALEQRRPPEQRIADDPHAAAFLGPLSRSATLWGRGWLGTNLFPATLLHFVLARQRFTDDALAAAIAAGVDQLVVVGAGYDTRAWRFGEQLAVAFEVDHPATAARKDRLVAALPALGVDRRAVKADLSVEDLGEVLQAAGFDPSRPAFFAWEGVTMYLSESAVLGALRTMRALMAPGSTLAFDVWWDCDAPGVAGALWRQAPPILGWIGEALDFQCRPDQVAALLEQAGLGAAEIAPAEVLEQRYVRDGRHLFRHCCLALAVPG